MSAHLVIDKYQYCNNETRIDVKFDWVYNLLGVFTDKLDLNSGVYKNSACWPGEKAVGFERERCFVLTFASNGHLKLLYPKK